MSNKETEMVFGQKVRDYANLANSEALAKAAASDIASSYGSAALSAALAQKATTDVWKELVGKETLASLQSAALANEAIKSPFIKGYEDSFKFKGVAGEMARLMDVGGLSAAEKYKSELDATLMKVSSDALVKAAIPDIAASYGSAALSAALAQKTTTDVWKELVGKETLASLQSAALANEAIKSSFVKGYEDSLKFKDVAGEMTRLMDVGGLSAAEKYKSELDATLINASSDLTRQQGIHSINAHDHVLDVSHVLPPKITKPLAKVENKLDEISQRVDKSSEHVRLIAESIGKTNSAILSVIPELERRHQENAESGKRSLTLAVFALFLSAVLTLFGLIQDYFNNRSGDETQDRLQKIITEQTTEIKRLREQEADNIKKLRAALPAIQKNESTDYKASKRKE